MENIFSVSTAKQRIHFIENPLTTVNWQSRSKLFYLVIKMFHIINYEIT